MPEPSVTPAPDDPAAALAAVIADLDNLTWDCGETVVDNALHRYLKGLRTILATLLARPSARPGPSWRRLALANPKNELLWRSSPPGGTWPAEGPHEALTWAGLDDFRGWLASQPTQFRARLGENGWRLVELETVAWTVAVAVTDEAPEPADAGAAAAP